ncbi:MAG: hypothetical protein GY679_04005, partial [Mycoplasma sp.]|nr:hypothetical protein [Mycoplasma sp.]
MEKRVEVGGPRIKAMKIAINNGRVIDPANQRDSICNLYIDNDVIVGYGAQAPTDFQAERVVDATGQWILPGMVDLAASISEQKKTIRSETNAAAHSGITHLCCVPSLKTPLDTTARINMIRRRANTAYHTNVHV